MNPLRTTLLVEVYSAADPIEAQMVCGTLEEEGIESGVVGDGLAFAGGYVPFGNPISPRIWVLEENAVRARQLIEQWEIDRRGGALPVKPPRFQFSLRTIFVVTTICAIACMMLGIVQENTAVRLVSVLMWNMMLFGLVVVAYIRRKARRARRLGH